MRFLDGPAKDAILVLARAPRFLRVVIDADGTLDALDQPGDTPKATEAIHVYRRTTPISHVIACSRGRGCQPMTVADYRLQDQQPSDAEARDTHAWREWAARQWLALGSPADDEEAAP